MSPVPLDIFLSFGVYFSVGLVLTCIWLPPQRHLPPWLERVALHLCQRSSLPDGLRRRGPPLPASLAEAPWSVLGIYVLWAAVMFSLWPLLGVQHLVFRVVAHFWWWRPYTSGEFDFDTLWDTHRRKVLETLSLSGRAWRRMQARAEDRRAEVLGHREGGRNGAFGSWQRPVTPAAVPPRGPGASIAVRVERDDGEWVEVPLGVEGDDEFPRWSREGAYPSPADTGGSLASSSRYRGVHFASSTHCFEAGLGVPYGDPFARPGAASASFPSRVSGMSSASLSGSGPYPDSSSEEDLGVRSGTAAVPLKAS